MLRGLFTGTLVLVALQAGQASGQEVKSFVVGSVPPASFSGALLTFPGSTTFVVTDINLQTNIGGTFELHESDGQIDTLRAFLNTRTAAEFHFNSGVTFTGGSLLKVKNNTSDPLYLTICGYIPGTTTRGNMPAVSTWGLVTIVLLILIAATFVLSPKRLGHVGGLA